MRVFVTGATGFIGSAVVQELIKAGHQVLGLARSDSSAKSLIEAGAEVHRGSLEDLESLRSGVASSDGVIHAGFIHDFSNFKESCEVDRRVIEAFGEELIGTNKPLVVSSGVGLLSTGQIVTEKDVPPSSSPNPRIATEEAVKAVVDKGVNASLLRLPPSVHGDGDHGFIPILINIAREKGVSAYIGEGKNRWPAVHVLDAAVLYRLILERVRTAGCYHGVAEEGVEFKEIAEVIGKRLNVPVVSKAPEEVPEHFTWFSHFAGMNCPSSNKLTREQLDWNPTHPKLIPDIDRDIYFKM